jgi:hypothetical protein
MLRLLIAVVMLSAAALPAMAQQDVFMGTWIVQKAQDAPWLKVRPELKPHYSGIAKNARIVIAAGRLEGPLNIGCRKPRYTVTMLAADSIFEGGLSDADRGLNDPQGLAQQLGVNGGQIPTLENSCSEQHFHLADKNTIVFARNNVIYTLKRAGAR